MPLRQLVACSSLVASTSCSAQRLDYSWTCFEAVPIILDYASETQEDIRMKFLQSQRLGALPVVCISGHRNFSHTFLSRSSPCSAMRRCCSSARVAIHCGCSASCCIARHIVYAVESVPVNIKCNVKLLVSEPSR